ncbi:MAG: alpha/beta fold hydrolase [Pseudonocardiaceae bacterium]|nr:alpha/beta fold hydrolase [Pseudonocardiaceae bacterium]
MGSAGQRRVADPGELEEWVRVDDGVRLWTATAGGGPTSVVLCHGGPGLWDYLQPVAAMLADVARVHRWEQRGCGRSDRTGPYSVARSVADLEFLRRRFGHQRWVVAGHSWGAGLALRYALIHPDRVLGVLYVSGTGFGRAWREAYHREVDRRLTPRQRRRRDQLKQRQRSAAEEREWRTLTYAPDFADSRHAFALAADFADVPHAINFACNAALNDEEKGTVEADLLTAACELDVPVRIVHGASDPRPVWAVQRLAEALPRAELVVLEGVGHLPWLEDPDAFHRTTRGFITR